MRVGRRITDGYRIRTECRPPTMLDHAGTVEQNSAHTKCKVKVEVDLHNALS